MNRKIVISLTSAGILFLAVGAVCLLNATGIRARTFLQPRTPLQGRASIRVVNNSIELYSLYKELGVHGRILVQFGKHLHYIAVSDNEVFKGLERFPVKPLDLLGEYEKRISNKNVLWVAMQGNIVRTIYYVLPSPLFRVKLESVPADSRDVISLSESGIIAHDWGSRRVISDRPPRTSEPVIMNIDASYLDAVDADELVQLLASSGLTADLITLDLAEDDEEVTAPARERLKALGVSMGPDGVRYPHVQEAR